MIDPPGGSPPGRHDDGDWPGYLHKMALVGIAIEVVVNAYELMNIVHIIATPLDQLIECYILLAGVACLVVEFGETLCHDGPQNKLIRMFPFLGYSRGRGLTYFVLGSLTASTGNLLPIVGLIELCGGLSLMFVGIMLVVLGPETKGPAAEQNAEHFERVLSEPEPETFATTSLHWAALVGLGVCVWVCVWDLTDLMDALFKPLDQLTELYCVIGALVCLALEGVHTIFCGKLEPSCIIKWFPFLSRRIGRGVSYIVLGSLEAAGGSLNPTADHFLRESMHFVGGYFLIAVGVAQAYLACRGESPGSAPVDQEMQTSSQPLNQ